MRVVYRQIPALWVVYARSTGPYQVSAPDAWERLLPWLDEHGLRQRVKQAYGIFRDDPSTIEPRLLRYDACVPLVLDVDAVLPDGLGRQTLRGGAYAVHAHVGSYDRAGAVFSQLRREVVPKRGLTVDHDRPFMAIHLNDPLLTREPHRRTELCIPVIPLRMPASSNDSEPVCEPESKVVPLRA